MADWLEEHDDPRRAELVRLHRRMADTCCEPDLHPERAAWQARIVELLGQGVRPCVPQRTVDLGLGVLMTFSFVPPGSFLRGSPEDEPGRGDDEARQRVTLAEGYWLGIHPVTRAQWQAVLGEAPGYPLGDEPVAHVSWNDCQEFCRALGEGTGLSFCLPTEAQWEHACRAGTTTAYWSGDGVEALRGVGWCSAEGQPGSLRGPGAVGQLVPNAWGLYDLHGNVSEWCQDRHEPPPGDPRRTRVLRGGSWYSQPRFCRSARRLWNEPDHRCSSCGCRVSLCPD
jgi:formylglycine-generating enzyme required for sulfatase activity